MAIESQSLPDDLAAVRAFCRRYRFTVLARTMLYRIATLAAVLLGALTLIQVCFAMFPWVGLPFVWDSCVFLFVIGAAAVAVDVLALHRMDLGHAAAMVEKRVSLPHPWLSLSLELTPSAGNGPAVRPAGLRSLVFERARRSLAACPASASFRVPLTKAALCIGSACAFLAALAVLEPSCAGFWQLPVSFFRPLSAVVSPGTVLVPSGTTCTLSCVTHPRSFPSCRMAVSSADARTGWRAETSRLIGADASGAFSTVLNKITATTVYQFTIGNTSLGPDTIRVAGRPFLSGLSVRLTPPAYTGLRPSALAEGQGNFAAYPGTRAKIRIAAPFALSSARFIAEGGDTVAMDLSDTARAEASCAVIVDKRKTYTFALADTFGQTSDSVPLFSMEIIPDMPPTVSFVKPGASRASTPAMAETLVVEAIDDIGIRGLSVSMRKNHDTSFVFYTQNAAAQRGGLQKSILAGFTCDLTRFSLYPGDTLFYWAAACDNRSYGPPQCAVTDTFFFRVPGFEEIHEQIAHEQDDAEQAVRATRKKQEALAKTAASLMQSSRNKQSLSWEQQQIAKDLKESVKEQADSLQKAVESFRSAVDKLKQQQSMPPELLSKMDQVQHELEDLRKQFGDSLLFKMPEKADNMTLRDLRESLEKFKAMLPDLSQRLDNTLKFLAMLKRDQALEKLAAKAERLAQSQRDISSSKENRAQGAECLAKQESQCNGVDSLMADIDKGAGAKGDSSLFSKNDLSALSQIRPLENSMRSDLGKKSMPPRGDMDRMAGSLMSLSQDFQNLQSCALAKKLDQDRATLLSMAHDALSLSSWHRDLRDNADAPSLDPGEASANLQTLKQSLLQSSAGINRLAVVSPSAIMSIKKGYDNAASSIDGSLASLAQPYGAFMSDGPGAALDMLAKTVFDAISDLDRGPQSQGGGMGMMMQSLRRLSGKQAMLNAMTGELLRRMLGENGSEGEQAGNGRKEAQNGGRKNGTAAADEKARREAQASQQAIADELKRLADKYGKEAGSSLDKRARELEEEARRLAQQFDALLDAPSPDLKDRQDRFLSRMLETTLSQHRQDEGKEDRISQSAKTVFGPAPGPQTSETGYGTDSFYRLRQRAFMGNFPESYRLPVKNYFDSLGVLFLKQ